MKRGRLLVVVCGLALVGAGLSVGDADSQRSAVRLLLPVGSISLPPSLSGGNFGGVATDASGNLYAGVIRGLLTHVAVFDREGRFLRSWRADSFSAVRLSDPVLAVGPDGLVYVAPQQRDFTPRDETVRVFRPDGTPVRTFGAGSGLNEVSDIEVDPAGNVYLASRAVPDQGIRDDVIVKFNPAGEVTARLAPVPGKPGQFGTSLRGLALAPDGSIYVGTDVQDEGFVRIDQSGRRQPAPDVARAIPSSRDHFRDVDFVNGKLYVAGDFTEFRRGSGTGTGLAVLTPEGRLLSVVLGEGGELAVSQEDVYVTRLHTPFRTTAGHLPGEIGHVNGQEAPIDPRATSSGGPNCRTAEGKLGGGELSGLTFVAVSNPDECKFVDFYNPNLPEGCARGHSQPVEATVGGGQVQSVDFTAEIPLTVIRIMPSEFRSGPVYLRWACTPPGGGPVETHYETKGMLYLTDPSGNVLDARTGRPVEAASVRLLFSPREGSPFGVPAISFFTPQVNPQVTDRTGFFGWDVAPGLWRLRITAFGYHPLTSKTYKVPPEVTGLKLRLRPDPRQQAVLVDPYVGRAGAARVGAKRGKRVSGLVYRVVRSRIRAITVRSSRFRTVHGVRVGATLPVLRDAYPRQAARLSARTSRVRVGKATFTVRRGRVASIVLGR